MAFAGPKSSPYIEDERTRKLGLEITQKVDYNEMTPEQAGEKLYTELEKLLKQMTRQTEKESIQVIKYSYENYFRIRQMKNTVMQTGIHCLFGERNKYNKEKKYEK